MSQASKVARSSGGIANRCCWKSCLLLSPNLTKRVIYLRNIGGTEPDTDSEDRKYRRFANVTIKTSRLGSDPLIAPADDGCSGADGGKRGVAASSKLSVPSLAVLDSNIRKLPADTGCEC